MIVVIAIDHVIMDIWNTSKYKFLLWFIVYRILTNEEVDEDTKYPIDPLHFDLGYLKSRQGQLFYDEYGEIAD